MIHLKNPPANCMDKTVFAPEGQYFLKDVPFFISDDTFIGEDEAIVESRQINVRELGGKWWLCISLALVIRVSRHGLPMGELTGFSPGLCGKMETCSRNRLQRKMSRQREPFGLGSVPALQTDRSSVTLSVLFPSGVAWQASAGPLEGHFNRRHFAVSGMLPGV
jgi:hypothetical protein